MFSYSFLSLLSVIPVPTNDHDVCNTVGAQQHMNEETCTVNTTSFRQAFGRVFSGMKSQNTCGYHRPDKRSDADHIVTRQKKTNEISGQIEILSNAQERNSSLQGTHHKTFVDKRTVFLPLKERKKYKHQFLRLPYHSTRKRISVWVGGIARLRCN